MRDGREGKLRAFAEQAFQPTFLEMAPLDVHLRELNKIREKLGPILVDGIRLSSPDAGDFVIRNAADEVYVLHLEVEPIEPYRVAGIGLEPYRPHLDIRAFESLDDARQRLSALEKQGEFSGVVLVARQGRPDWVRACGMANKQKGIANTPATRFDVGSITKDFTAVAIMQLVEAGKVELDAPMGRYLKGFPEKISGKVTVRQLLRMESGYGDYFNHEFEKRRTSLRTVSDYLDWFKTFDLGFEPGTGRRYSNVGYVLLGGIVESASGLAYEDSLRRHVFAPAGMKTAVFRDLSVENPKSAIGYTNDGVTGQQGYVETNRAVMEVRGTPAGGSFCTADDLLRFHRALRANRLLDEAQTSFLLRGFEDGDGRPAVRGIAGGAPGVSAVSLEDTEAGLNVIVLSNLDEPLAETVGEPLFRLLRHPQPAQPAQPEPKPPASQEPVRVVGQVALRAPRGRTQGAAAQADARYRQAATTLQTVPRRHTPKGAGLRPGLCR